MPKIINYLVSKPWYFLLLSVLSGTFLSLSWYQPFTLFIFGALAPLLEVERRIAQSHHKWPKLTFWLYSLLALLIWNVGVIWWLWNASGWATLAAWIANAMLQTLPLVLFQMTKRASYNKFGALTFVALWLSFEYIHLNWSLSWPWLNLGHAFGNTPSWVQWYEYTGALGGTLWVLFANILAHDALFNERRRIGWAAIILLPMAISFGIGYTYTPQGEVAEVVAVQPNYDCYSQKFEYNAKTGEPNTTTHVPYMQQIAKLVSLSEQAITPSTKFVLWPETAMHEGVDEAEAMQYADVMRAQEMVNKHRQITLIAGIDAHVRYNTAQTSTTRYQKNYGYYEKFGAALKLDSTQQTDFYHKSKLVIGAETIPFYPVMKHLILNFGGTVGGLGTQPKREVFTQGTAKAAPVICYESVYGDFMTEYIQQGANFIAVITNDGWWGDTPGHLQHLYFSNLRAIELRRDVARSANTGVSAFINQKGEIVSTLAYNAEGALRGTVMLNDKLTVYVQMGDYIGRLAAFFAAYILLSAFVKKRMNKNLGIK